MERLCMFCFLDLDPFVFVLQWWKPLHIIMESGTEKCSHPVGVGCHGAQDPGSLPAPSRAYQCYRGPRVCTYMFFSVLRNNHSKEGGV